MFALPSEIPESQSPRGINMSLLAPGRLVMKIAGRDAGRIGVIVEQLDAIYVLVDGGVRRKKVNSRHVEPLETVIELKKGASHEEVARIFQKQGLAVWETKAKMIAEKPLSLRKQKSASGKKAVSEKKKE